MKIVLYLFLLISITLPSFGQNPAPVGGAIDLGDLYLQMEELGDKGVTGKMTQYIPKSSQAHKRQTEYALSLLPKETKTETIGRSHKELPEQYWTDIVTEQPEGYVVDANGNVHIYSAEGLAWLSVLSNGLHGQEADNFDGKTVSLEAEVDMSEALWTPICQLSNWPFKGTFNGNEFVIGGIQLVFINYYLHLSGFFGNLFGATLSNIVIRDGYYEGNYSGIGFLASRATLCHFDHCFVECEMHGGSCAPFVYSNFGSTITNSMVYCPLLQNEDGHWGGIFVAGNSVYDAEVIQPKIKNCAAIVKQLDWSINCGFVGHTNYGIIDNCYAYIEEITNMPNPIPLNLFRNGIARYNEGTLRNCYYNNPLKTWRDDGWLVLPLYNYPCTGLTGIVSETPSFDKDDFGFWKLAQPITFDFGASPITTDVLLDALNYRIEELNNGNLLDWCDTVTGFDNQQLPVFCGIDIVEINEHQTDDNQVVLFPNPSDGNIRIEGVEVVELQVFNTLGQLVKAYNNINEIFLGNLPSGLYLIRIIDHKGDLITKKVLVE